MGEIKILAFYFDPKFRLITQPDILEAYFFLYSSFLA